MNKYKKIFQKIRLQEILLAYRNGIFPMAENANSGEVFWVEPKKRGVIILNDFKIGRKLKKVIRNNLFEIRIDTNFKKVIESCAEKRLVRSSTWINASIIDAYLDLHYKGYAHSVECYEKNILVGGLYGVSMGSIFFGESMFSFVEGASKVALLHLLERLKVGQYNLLDTQFLTKHLKLFGAIEISQKHFLSILEIELKQNADFFKIDNQAQYNGKKYPKIENFR